MTSLETIRKCGYPEDFCKHVEDGTITSITIDSDVRPTPESIAQIRQDIARVLSEKRDLDGYSSRRRRPVIRPLAEADIRHRSLPKSN